MKNNKQNQLPNNEQAQLSQKFYPFSENPQHSAHSHQQQSQQLHSKTHQHQQINNESVVSSIIPTHPTRTDTLISQAEPNQSQLDYYEEYKKIYLISYHLFIQKNHHAEIKSQVEKKIKTIEEKMRDLERLEAPKKENTSEENRIKRIRRTAEEIQRRYKCTVQFCQRCYGSEGSLQQHIKLKHPELYKKYNEKLQREGYDRNYMNEESLDGTQKIQKQNAKQNHQQNHQKSNHNNGFMPKLIQ